MSKSTELQSTAKIDSTSDEKQQSLVDIVKTNNIGLIKTALGSSHSQTEIDDAMEVAIDTSFSTNKDTDIIYLLLGLRPETKVFEKILIAQPENQELIDFIGGILFPNEE